MPRCRAPTGLLLLLLTTLARSRAPAAAPPASRPQAAPATAAALPSPKLDVKNWTLANGLNVLFLADHKAPIATVQVFYHVGSKDEHVGIRGVAHMFEHMMFKGSEHVPPEEHARLLKEVGGQVNAFTTEDLTAYHDTVPPSYVGFALQLEAERMRHLKLFPATIDSERQVVEEEKRLRVDNDPIGKAIEKFRALAYVKHPYNWTPIGTIEDLEKVTPADCQRFYDTYYQPNNATLIVVGDVDEAAVRKLVEQHFGPIPRGPAPPRAAVEEPPQTAPRAETLHIEVQMPVVVGGYHIPRAADPDIPALEVLAAVLSARRVVAPAPAPGAAASTWRSPPAASPRRWSTRGCSSSTPPTCPIAIAARVQAALAEEIARVRDKPITRRRAGQGEEPAGRRRSCSGCRPSTASRRRWAARSTSRATGSAFVEGATRYLAVTAADVQRVAQKYLVDTNLTRVTLAQPAPAARSGKQMKPRASLTLARCCCSSAARRAPPPRRQPPRRPPSAVAGAAGARAAPPSRKPPADVLGGAQRSRSARPRRRSRPSWRCRPSQRFTLKNGLEVIVVAAQGPAGRQLRHRRPGRRLRRESRHARACPTSSRRCSGAAPRRAAPTTSRSAIDFVGGTLDAQATNESTTAGCSALSKDAKLCLDLLSDILLHPSFPESEMGEVRDEMLAGDRGALRQPARARERALRRTCCSARSTPTAGC